MVHQIKSASEFRDATASGAVFVDFFATWCGPCKAISPLVDQLEPQYPNIKFLKLDVEEVSDIASQYQVSAIPTFLFFKDGKVVHVVRGADPPQIKKGLQELAG